MNVEAKHIYLYLTHGETVKPFAQRQADYGRNGGESYISVSYTHLIVCTVTALLTLTTGMWTTADYDTGAIAQAAFHNAFGKMCIRDRH